MLIDSDILIDYLRGEEPAITFLEANVDRLHVSSISVAELYQGVRDGEETDALEAMLEVVTVLDLTANVAKAGGLFRRKYGKSHGCGLADCLIAATAVTHGLELSTLNTKHYPMLEKKRSPYSK
jgi:predicted nucleic acid-binding protein